MYTKVTSVINKTGLHARPASDLVKTSKTFDSEIIMCRVGEEDYKVNVKSMVMLLTLGIEQGESVEICANGDDEVLAVDTLISLIDSGFGELQEG